MTSEDLYRILLKVYPARYRYKYEQAMTQCFRDQLRAADTTGKQVRLWFGTMIDFALNAPARHLKPPPRSPYPNVYSERARRAIYFAQLEKGPLSYGKISLENLLLGALGSDEELAGALLGSHGLAPLVTRVRSNGNRQSGPARPSPSLGAWASPPSTGTCFGLQRKPWRRPGKKRTTPAPR